MKKILFIFTVMILGFAFTGCGVKPNEKSLDAVSKKFIQNEINRKLNRKISDNKNSRSYLTGTNQLFIISSGVAKNSVETGNLTELTFVSISKYYDVKSIKLTTGPKHSVEIIPTNDKEYPYLGYFSVPLTIQQYEWKDQQGNVVTFVTPANWGNLSFAGKEQFISQVLHSLPDEGYDVYKIFNDLRDSEKKTTEESMLISLKWNAKLQCWEEENSAGVAVSINALPANWNNKNFDENALKQHLESKKLVRLDNEWYRESDATIAKNIKKGLVFYENAWVTAKAKNDTQKVKEIHDAAQSEKPSIEQLRLLLEALKSYPEAKNISEASDLLESMALKYLDTCRGLQKIHDAVELQTLITNDKSWKPLNSEIVRNQISRIAEILKSTAVDVLGKKCVGLSQSIAANEKNIDTLKKLKEAVSKFNVTDTDASERIDAIHAQSSEFAALHDKVKMLYLVLALANSDKSIKRNYSIFYKEEPFAKENEDLISSLSSPCKGCNGTGWLKCEKCDGSGDCPKCGGKGYCMVRNPRGVVVREPSCPVKCYECNGVGAKKCPACLGRKQELDSQKVAKGFDIAKEGIISGASEYIKSYNLLIDESNKLINRYEVGIKSIKAETELRRIQKLLLEFDVAYCENRQPEVDRNLKDEKQDSKATGYDENRKIKERVSAKELVERDGIIYKINSDEPFAGCMIVKYENGQIEGEGNFKDGKLDGKAIGYYENGKIEYEENYKDGKQNGKKIGYYENGQIEGEENYKDGELDGKAIKYYKNGKIEAEGNFKDGKEVGKFISYYENGKIKVEENYKNGKLDGKATEYYENGQIKAEGNFKDGREVGLSDVRSGRKKAEGSSATSGKRKQWKTCPACSGKTTLESGDSFRDSLSKRASCSRCKGTGRVQE